VTSFFFFYENVIEIFINVERALCFSKINDFKRFKNISPYIICLILLIVSIVIHSPNYFIFTITQDFELPKLLKSCKVTQFGSSSFGRIAQAVSYLLEGPVVVLLVIITNVISLISFRRYKKRKAQLQGQTAQTSATNPATERIEKIDRKLLRMVVLMTSFSVVIHSVILATQFVVLIFQITPLIGAWFGFSTAFVRVLKEMVNVFFLYFGNTQFKQALNTCKTQQQQQPRQTAESTTNRMKE